MGGYSSGKVSMATYLLRLQVFLTLSCMGLLVKSCYPDFQTELFKYDIFFPRDNIMCSFMENFPE